MLGLPRNTLRLYGRLLGQARGYWPHVALYLLLSLLATPLALLVPLPLKIAVDSVLGSHPLPGFLAVLLPAGVTTSPQAMMALVAALVVAFALLALGQQLGAAMLRTYVGEKLVLHFRTELFRHVQRLSLSYHDTKGTADSIYRIQYDAPAVQALVVESIVPSLSNGCMLVGMLYVTARLNARLALVALAVAPILLLVTLFFSSRLRRRWREVKKLESSAQSVVQEALSAVRVVKAFSRETHEQDRFVRQYRQGVAARLRVSWQEYCYGLLVGMTTAAGTAAVLWIGVGDVRSGTMSLGNLLLVMAYLKQLYEPLRALGKQLASKQRALASAERAFALLDELPEVTERPDALPIVRARGAIEFRGVCFAYPQCPLVLKGVCFDVPAGTRVGIAGRTGAGKTTLTNLLARFYDPAGGTILLDGRDLREYKLADLRNQFSIVLQESVLFSTSIAENIAYGRPGATEAEIIQAAQAANAHEFIAALPEGYATRVGERGMRLSGGERQRIALARAFLKDAPILVLDEPTSSVDTGTEASIMEAMQRLMVGRTTFLIAHRLSTLKSCELFLHLRDGALATACWEDLASMSLSSGAAPAPQPEVAIHV